MGSILDENTKYSHSAWNGDVVWFLSIFSGKAVKFDFLQLEIRSRNLSSFWPRSGRKG